MGHFDGLSECDNAIQHHCTSLAGSVNFDRIVVHPELQGLPWTLKIEPSQQMSLCVLVCFALLQDRNASPLPCHLFS